MDPLPTHGRRFIARASVPTTVMQMLVNLFSRMQPQSIEERCLAQAVDARDLEVRLLALERARP